ncbi:MAG: prolyl-tRNA synthetase associated domain-containing protein [Clostridia bacterium]|nr:prolyl-tRNA synthetase associated domain-containing protein [Clostridia bacterium]
MLLHTGRPAEARTPREDAAYDYLDKLNIAYRRVDHEAAMTMEDCEAIDRILGVRMCKNLFLCNRQKTDFCLLLMPGDKPFRTKELSAQLGVARLSFGSAEDMEAKLGLLPGSVSVMGLINDTEGAVCLLIDKDLLDDVEIGCHPCMNTSSIAFSMEDLLQKVLPATGHTPTAVTLTGE